MWHLERESVCVCAWSTSDRGVLGEDVVVITCPECLIENVIVELLAASGGPI